MFDVSFQVHVEELKDEVKLRVCMYDFKQPMYELEKRKF